ncbi:hypothetical protein PR048_025936 [Dryococelus australis]|uniref:Uncharacterized protein n=1 Tax=Dryococelus australis TaxID=614101 RepID=A0ABQ9GJY7_9NEOP|nr:hypothetical protein PR048_025936 [Dryococelus australis]
MTTFLAESAEMNGPEAPRRIMVVAPPELTNVPAHYRPVTSAPVTTGIARVAYLHDDFGDPADGNLSPMFDKLISVRLSHPRIPRGSILAVLDLRIFLINLIFEDLDLNVPSTARSLEEDEVTERNTSGRELAKDPSQHWPGAISGNNRKLRSESQDRVIEAMSCRFRVQNVGTSKEAKYADVPHWPWRATLMACGAEGTAGESAGAGAASGGASAEVIQELGRDQTWASCLSSPHLHYTSRRRSSGRTEDVSGGGGTVAERLARSPPTKANRAQPPAGSPDFRKWEQCRTMPLVGGFSRGSPASPAPSFLRRSIFTSMTPIGC